MPRNVHASRVHRRVSTIQSSSVLRESSAAIAKAKGIASPT
jgi:hypothetical protein